MTLKTLVYLHHHIYLGVGWTAICTQNPGIARKGRGGGVLPLARIFFGGFGNVFQASFWTIWRRLLGSCMGGSAPCQDFLGGFGSHYKICCENFEALFQANQYANAVCVNIKTLSLPSKCSLSTKTYLTKWPIKSTKVQLSDDYCTLYCINTV